jgi:hypothetical protein
LLVRVMVLAITVGAIVTAAAALDGAGSCSSPAADGVSDSVCLQLVRTLAERVGILAGSLTAILVLTMVGLSRLSAHQDPLDRPARPLGWRRPSG